MTPTFRKNVRDLLELNERSNVARGLRKGQDGYLISSQAELAEALSEEIGKPVDKNNIKKLLGPVREDSKPIKLTDRSTYVAPIRRVLKMAPLVKISVPSGRASVLAAIAELPDDLFARIEAAVMNK